MQMTSPHRRLPLLGVTFIWLGCLAGLVLLMSSPLLAKDAERLAGDGAPSLGRLDFPTSGGPEAQKHFLEGVLWLHSFEYRDAREAFQKARELEPDFAMAAWGEAMTYNHPIWLEENVEAAREALDRLAPTPAKRAAKAPTKREKGYLETVEILFGDGDKVARDHAYAAALARLAERFPNDHEAKSFHALAILGTCHAGRDIPTYMEAAAVAEEVFAENPEHPGAVHYLIHAYDDPVHAPLGLRPARIYARIAPAAEHALHMPSHIFLARGMWEDAVASNIDSWEAGEHRVARDDLPTDRRNYHALYWLHYARLQQGRQGDAEKLLDVILDDAAASGSQRARAHRALMRAAHLVETEDWTSAPDPTDLDELSVRVAAADLYATGRAALAASDVAAARKALDEIHRRIDAARAEDGRTSESGYSKVGPARTAEAEVMALELEGLISKAGGDADAALVSLRAATEKEDALSFGFGPPVPVEPSHELLGEVLLELGRAAEAREHFEAALARAPNRRQSVAGLARAENLTHGSD